MQEGGLDLAALSPPTLPFLSSHPSSLNPRIPLCVCVCVCVQVLSLHDGAVLCCGISPDGSQLISSGKDEHICVIDCETGEEVFDLDDALDGRGLTVKFSFDGTRVQVRA